MSWAWGKRSERQFGVFYVNRWNVRQGKNNSFIYNIKEYNREAVYCQVHSSCKKCDIGGDL